jgi:NDP-sugar pyrophosphorylase family protein
MKAIILSGGLGLRLRPLTDDKPKPLIPVNGKPIAEFQLDWLISNAELNGVIFACGYRWDKLKDHFGESYKGIPIEYTVEKEPLGTGGAIKNSFARLDERDEKAVIMNGDLMTDLPLRRMVDWHNSPSTQTTVTMLVVPYRSRFGVVYIDKLRMVRKFEEKPEFPDVWINGGIYVVDVNKIAKHLPEKGDIERETFPKLVPYGEISAFPHYGFWRLIDSIKDLHEVEVELSVPNGS